MVKYPLASSTWDDKEVAAIHQVIASDMYSMGESVFEYEKRFAEFFGCKYAVMVSSGSAANLIMIAALFFRKDNPLKRGDEIIVPAVSWSTTYFPLQQYGLKVKFVDIDKDTLNIDLAKLEDAITDKTRAILLVNLLGNPNHFDAIKTLVAGKNITLLEDNCESMGATFNGKQAGTYGVMGTYSSFFSHHIATMEGGCVVTDDEELHHLLLCLRAHGWTRNLPEKNWVTGTKSSDPFEESFKFALPGYNVRPLEMSGAVGIEQLKKLPDFIQVRRDNAAYFAEKMSEFSFLSTQKEVGKSSWFGFSMIVEQDSPFTRTEIIKQLTNNHIDTRPIVSGNFLKNKQVLQYFDYEISGEIQVADIIDTSGFFVGNHQVPLQQEIDHLYETIKLML